VRVARVIKEKKNVSFYDLLELAAEREKVCVWAKEAGREEERERESADSVSERDRERGRKGER